MKKRLLQLIYGSFWTVDACWGVLQRCFRPESASLICLMFHNPFRDKAEARSGNGSPGEKVTCDDIERCLDWFRRAGYRFIHPHEAATVLEQNERAVLISFDDAYLNCIKILSLLEKYSAPAVVFVVTRPVMEGKIFWWDALWRAELRRGGSAASASAAVERMKDWHYEEIERELTERYGEDAFNIEDDAFRPMTPDELRAFARHPLITIGNHTHEHVALDICGVDGVKTQTAGAQIDLKTLTGKSAASIAYPYGRYTPETLEVAGKLGLVIGLSCHEGKNVFKHANLLELRRFNPQGWWNISIQCMRYCTDNSLTPKFILLLQEVLKLRKNVIAHCFKLNDSLNRKLKNK